MFATVEFYEGEKGFGKRLKRVFTKNRIISQRVELPENECFYKLKVPLHKGRIPEDRLRRMAAGITGGVIFPDGADSCNGIKVYKSSWFRDILLFNSAVSCIEKSVLNPAETLITVIDKKGVLHTETDRLVNLAGEIKIVTDNTRAYEGTAKRIMQEYGLSLLVSDKLSSIPDRGIIISRRSNIIPVYFKGLLITEEKRLFPFARVMTGEGIRVKEEYVSLCPTGINMTDFISALCEFCFVRELRKSEYERMIEN